MLIAGRDFSDEILARIRETVQTRADLTRGALARQVCDWFDWRGADGRPKEISCRVTLNKLEQRGLIELPPARPVSFAPRTPRPAQPAPRWPCIETSLSKVRGIELVVVNGDRELSRQWCSMMQAHHPLGDGPLCGAQLRYLIRSAQGVVGGLSFSAPAWRLGVRDAWIGWTESMRAARLTQVVGNTRFLILPSVKVKNLASHVLGLATQRLAGDWQVRYGERVLLVETFVDTSRYEGTCYRAANWIDLGITQGRGRQDRERTARLAAKRVLVYPLQRHWRKILSAPLHWPRIVPSARAQPPADWAEEEFGRCRLSAPLTQRVLRVARDFYARPQATIPHACNGDTASINGAYRLFAHEDTNIETLLQSHYAATEERIGQHAGEVILVAQDTTSLNYTHLAHTLGLGPIGTQADGAQGLHLHSSWAMSTQGLPLGFVDAQCWARDAEEFGKKALRHDLPIEQKESYRWIKGYRALAAVQQRHPGVTLVSMGDREADIYELFDEAAQDPSGPKLLIRAKHDRALEDETARLFKTIAAQPIAGYLHVQIPRQKDRPAREAKLAIRFATLNVCPPHGKADLPVLPMQAVHALEEGAPKGEEPVDWQLLTTLPVHDFEQATEKVQWYTQRWGIEVFHRTLKSGCRIEDRQLGDAERLEACLAIDMVVAWRICHLVKLGREVPHLPATVYFEEAEWKALCAYSTKKPLPPPQPPTLGKAIHMVAQLGGFRGRKSDGDPGAEVMWRGLQHLDDITETWRVLQGHCQQLPRRNDELTEALRVAMTRGP
ncbi:MAG: IS4 family transposase [Sulfuricaulis sp.]|nr:IS4 family transposase [Sulfuricaulis sp.]